MAREAFSANHPNDPRTLEAPEGFLESLIRKFYDGGWRDECQQCPRYSAIRQDCMVLADGLSVDECPQFEHICEEDRIREMEGGDPRDPGWVA